MRFPDIFGSTEWLGDFLEQDQKLKSCDVAYGMRQHLSDLEDLNYFSKKYHHATNRAASREPITDSALRPYVARTLKLLRG